MKRLLIEKFCPNIFGYNHIKLALILSLLGYSNRNDENNETEEKRHNRSNIHVLLFGDSGVGKTTLLKYCSQLITPSRFLNAHTTSEVGLTACAVKKDTEWILEAGSLVITNNGILCLDNIDSLYKNEKDCLLEAMEQQLVSVSKVGMNVRLNAKCTILAVSNCKTKSQKQKLFNEFSGPLLSRFDLLFYLGDPGRCYDDKIAEYAFDNFRHDVSEIKKIINVLRFTKIEHNNNLNILFLKYYKYKTKLKTVKIEFFTLRLIEGLVRICIAHAKLCGNKETKLDDVMCAIILHDCTIKTEQLVNFNPDKLFLSEEYYKSIVQKYYDLLEIDETQF